MQEVYKQLFCLGIFAITGIIIGILFDIFRILRKSFKTADAITYIQDILFWILAGAVMLFSIFTFNNGEIRSYVFIGMAAGIIIYILTISKPFIKYSVNIIKFIKKILSYPIKLMTNILKKFIINPAYFVIRKFLNFFKKMNKKMHNITKFNKNYAKNNKKLKKKKEFYKKCRKIN